MSQTTIFKTKEDAVTWVMTNIPFGIRPVNKLAKTTFVAPFTSGNAFRVVCETLGEKLFELVNNETTQEQEESYGHK